MECTEITCDVPLIRGPYRSKGLHLTDIIQDMLLVLGKDYKGPDNPLWAEVGFVWEELLSMAWGSALGARPGEVELDGVVMSPDGLDRAHGILEEYKATWRSTNTVKTPCDEWKWMTQVKAYCKALGVTTVRFRILYLMGDYRGSGPVYKEFFIEFTSQELDDNWNMLSLHRDTMRRRKK